MRHPSGTVGPMADDLLEALRTLTNNPAAEFRPGQREAIEALAVHRQKVLLVQRTGWGKSAVYFVATHLLRRQGLGPTLLISPLLALIRNQIEAAERLGLRTMTINSSTNTTVGELAAALDADTLDLVLVSPERLANPEFADKAMPLLGRRPALMVIDEAHCISDWGHDFRPDYRRLAQVIQALGNGSPVLACTATANDRVVADVADQLGAVGNVIRGPLWREGLGLHVVELPTAAERLAWLLQVLPTLPGTGIIYCLTVHDAERVALWLRLRGHAVLPYTGGSDGDDRVQAEEKLQRNEVKALVATSALGMGYDKPDLAFVVHFQAPGSPVAYYQQVGRAGRQLDASVGILLRGTEDRDIQDWFINTAFPEEADVNAVLAAFAFAPGPLTVNAVLERVNLKFKDVELVLKQLTVEGVLRRLKGNTYERTLKPYTYPAERVAAVAADRRHEQFQMETYAALEVCRMAFLTEMLDDPDPHPCGVCDVCAVRHFDVSLDDALVEEAQHFVRRGYFPIEPRKRRHGRPLPEIVRLEEGRALCRWNDPGWGRLVADGKHAGAFDPRLVASLVEMVREWAPDPFPTWVTFVPSLRHPELVPATAKLFAEQLGLPLRPIVAKVRETPQQKLQQNTAHQEQNVDGAFQLTSKPAAQPVFLFDDLVDSKWTFTTIGILLRQNGSGPVYPLALASLMGRDS